MINIDQVFWLLRGLRGGGDEDKKKLTPPLRLLFWRFRPWTPGVSWEVRVTLFLSLLRFENPSRRPAVEMNSNIGIFLFPRRQNIRQNESGNLIDCSGASRGDNEYKAVSPFLFHSCDCARGFVWFLNELCCRHRWDRGCIREYIRTNRRYVCSSSLLFVQRLFCQFGIFLFCFLVYPSVSPFHYCLKLWIPKDIHRGISCQCLSVLHAVIH